jgi:hypothetical protein
MPQLWRYLVIRLFIARPEEIMGTGKVIQTPNLLIVSTVEKLVMFKPIDSSLTVEMRLMEMSISI